MRLTTLITAMTLSLLMGCGQKGPLYLPEPEVAPQLSEPAQASTNDAKPAIEAKPTTATKLNVSAEPNISTELP